MTYYVIGDFHGRSIEEFVEEESPDSNDTIVSTGDFDQVSVINEFIDLKEKIGEENVVDVGGNHDYALLHEKAIKSGTVISQSKTFDEMVEDLHENDNDRSKAYLESILDPKIKEFKLADRSCVLVHGGLTGYLQNPEIDEEAKPLWYRLWYEKDFKKNFEIMQKEGYDIGFRGHDHWTEHAFLSKEISEDVSYNLPEPGDSYKLDDTHRHIITHGPWFEGHYLSIDEEKVEVKFEQI